VEVIEPVVSEESESDSEDDFEDIFEVFSTKKKKSEFKASKLPELAPITTIPAVEPSGATRAAPASTLASSSPRPPPQYRYQVSAEDQQLTAQLFQWFLEGKIAQATPAHILASSPAIRKELSEKLRNRRVETASFAEAPEPTSPTPPPSSVLKLATPRTPAYSLPLREIDVQVSGLVTEAGVIDSGAQIVVIRKDLARDIRATINPAIRLEMEGASGAKNWTLGCVENLPMRIGSVAFPIHAHVVEHAPFRLLLGLPFQNLLLCRFEELPDGRVDVCIHDPADPTHTATVPSRPRKAFAGYVCTLALTALSSPPPPPSVNALHPYLAEARNAAFQQNHSAPPVSVAAYKKVARKVRPVPASLLEDFRTVRHIPKDPLLTLPACYG
jgi:gag-polyprotein putative aspartyl protease